MVNDITPFLGGSGALPPMNTAERKLWAASHNLPDNMVLVSTDEMHAMNEAFQAGVREVQMWRGIGRKRLKADLPEGFDQAVCELLNQKRMLEAKVRELTAKIPPE